MDLKLHGKSALVSGSTGGIGFAIALGLAQEGASVIVNGRSEEGVADAIARIKHYIPDAKVSGVVADAGTASEVEQLVQKVPHVDILINNVGIYEPKTFFDITDKDWLKIFEVNVFSGVRLSRQYLQKQLEQNWGRIIFISSESAIQIPVEMIHYGTTKTAQLAIARGLAEITVGTGVTVNSVLPGPTRSEGVEDFITKLAQERGISAGEVEAEFFQNVRPTSLIKRFATNEEVAAIVVYLSSPVASATNGAALRVDGGVIRSIV